MATGKRSSKKGTRSRAFGSSSRENHDASGFYNSSLYAKLPAESNTPYTQTELPADARNRIFAHSSEDMHELPDNSVHLMVTSPPYNAGKEYDKDLDLEQYLGMLRRVWAETLRVLMPGGRACINVANLGRKPYIPLHAFIIHDMLSLGYLMRGEIIWDKASSAGGSTAWGSWRSASNPTLRDVHEYILVFSKDRFGRPAPKDANRFTSERDDFLQNTKSVWSFPTVSAKKIGHPAPFPEELPRRLIELYTFPGEVVLDPFMGSGTSAIAALRTERSYVGYEMDKKYAKLAEKRIASSTTQAT
ncbi:MAG: site-specific DNA-methyltransferase [Anaerolineales bacterium]|nr:MAG: site-specific DNA-methyltransferase [Anaerolineales bacterium]